MRERIVTYYGDADAIVAAIVDGLRQEYSVAFFESVGGSDFAVRRVAEMLDDQTATVATVIEITVPRMAGRADTITGMQRFARDFARGWHAGRRYELERAVARITAQRAQEG